MRVVGLPPNVDIVTRGTEIETLLVWLDLGGGEIMVWLKKYPFSTLILHEK